MLEWRAGAAAMEADALEGRRWSSASQRSKLSANGASAVMAGYVT